MNAGGACGKTALKLCRGRQASVQVRSVRTPALAYDTSIWRPDDVHQIFENRQHDVDTYKHMSEGCRPTLTLILSLGVPVKANSGNSVRIFLLAVEGSRPYHI